MKVVHVNTHLSGGAGQAALRLHDGLMRRGVHSEFYARGPIQSDDAHISGFRARSGLLPRIGHYLRRNRIIGDMTTYAAGRPAGLEIFSDDRCEYAVEVADGLPPCDLVNLHWVAGFIDYTSFFPAVSKPIVWTLHDMNPFTGGCHYDAGCDAFRKHCGRCPQLGSNFEEDLSHAIWQRKQRSYRSVRGRMHIVTPSVWLQRQAQASMLFTGLPMSVIPNGLDTDIFLPRDSKGLRAALNIPGDAAVVLFVADRVENRRKGYSLLLDVVGASNTADNVYFISVGSGSPEKPLPRHIHLGCIQSELMMSVIYSMADLFVIPSLEDNLPNTVLESMACGTPVVGFDIGGIPDMVRPGQTGQLVSPGDVAAMSDVLSRLLQDPAALNALGKQCREVAVREYDLSVQAGRYAQLYASLLEGAHS